MPTPADPSIPVFSYVGRLKDSRKGLELFLDALVLLWADRQPASFRAWVIGGNEADRAWAVRLASCQSVLRDRISTSDLTFWGRIENEALPEFYSRSTALVVPSFREQFGITAVEAMMCGCPVIAARVGGLQDIVIDARTGNLFDRGSATSLAGVMSSYITVPDLPRWLGANATLWSHRTFGAGPIYDVLQALLADPAGASCTAWAAQSETSFKALVIEEHLPIVERILSAPIALYQDLTSGPSVSFMVETVHARRAFVKLYSSRPTDLSLLHNPIFSDPSLALPRERLLLALTLQGQSFFPEVLGYDLETGLIVQSWCAPEELSHDAASAAKAQACRRINEFDPAPELISTRTAIHQRQLEAPEIGRELLDEIDHLAAALHAPIIGGNVRLRRFHPQLELLRLHEAIDRNAPWLPRDYVLRAQALVCFLLNMEPLIPSFPAFAHGSLKKEHLLSSDLLCDFDHAGYYCGPVDAAHWIWEHSVLYDGYHPRPMFARLWEEVPDSHAWFLGICWILVFRLTKDVTRFIRGLAPIATPPQFFYEFTEAFRAFYSVTNRRPPTSSATQYLPKRPGSSSLSPRSNADA
jgi:hypothetical protein